MNGQNKHNVKTVGSTLKLGKGGGFLQYLTNAFKVIKADGVSLAPIEVANATLQSHAITLGQFVERSGFTIIEGEIKVGSTLPEPTVGKVFICTQGSSSTYVLQHIAGYDFRNQITNLQNLNWTNKTNGAVVYMKQLVAVSHYFVLGLTSAVNPYAGTLPNIYEWQNGTATVQANSLGFSGSFSRINAYPISVGSVISMQYQAANYVEGKLYVGNGTGFTELTLKDGSPVAFNTSYTLTTSGKIYYPDRVWIWDTTSSSFYDTKELVIAKDIEITDSTKGVIYRSPDGSRWRSTIGNDGIFITTKIV